MTFGLLVDTPGNESGSAAMADAEHAAKQNMRLRISFDICMGFFLVIFSSFRLLKQMIVPSRCWYFVTTENDHTAAFSRKAFTCLGFEQESL